MNVRLHTAPRLDEEHIDDSPAFAPFAVEGRYEAPAARIDPDRSKSWLRRALPIALAHKRIFLPALILSFAGLVLQVQIPEILNRAVDNSLVAHTAPLSSYVWWVVALAAASGVCQFFSRLFLYKTAYSIEFDLRNIVYEHLTRMSFSFYDRVQSGQLISRANSDIRAVQMYMAFAPSILVQCSIAGVAFAYMLMIDVWLALVAMATMPFVYIVGVRMRKAMYPISWLIQARLADVATVVDENVSGIRVVRSFAAEKQQLRTLAASAERLQWGYVKDADIRGRFTPLVQNLPQTGLAVVLLFGGYLVVNGKLGIGAILAFNAYLLMLQVPFMMLGQLIMMSQRAAASADRIYEILDEQPTINDRPDAIELASCRGDVRFESVSFAYPHQADSAGDDHAAGSEDEPRYVLRDVGLHVRPGETIALVGRTSAGKSTVTRLLARFYDADRGSVRVDGHDVRDLTLMSLRSHIGIVLDEPFLFSMSIRDNIAYGKPGADMDDVRKAAVAAFADEFIRELPEGYDTVVGERGYTLSGGQRQRIAIARTLLVNPPILVLDDATSAIDVRVEQEIHSALRSLMKGRTTLIIAHRLSTISLADRVVLLDDGRVVADGTHHELMATSPLYLEVLAQAEADDDDRPTPQAADTLGVSVGR